MRALLLALVCTAGCSAEPLLEKVQRPLLVDGPVDCVAVCQALSRELFEAGVTPDCASASRATDCATCREFARQEWGAELPACR